LETREGAGGWAKKCCDKKGKAQSGKESATVLQCCSKRTVRREGEREKMGIMD